MTLTLPYEKRMQSLVIYRQVATYMNTNIATYRALRDLYNVRYIFTRDNIQLLK